MKKLFKYLVLVSFFLTAFSSASVTRLYVGSLDSQFMAGVDARVDFGPFFVAGDVRTLISRAVINEEDKVIGFMPDRTDYKTAFGIVLGNVEIEYAHTCYHRVISSTDIALYQDNQNPEDTNTIAIRVTF